MDQVPAFLSILRVGSPHLKLKTGMAPLPFTEKWKVKQNQCIHNMFPKQTCPFPGWQKALWRVATWIGRRKWWFCWFQLPSLMWYSPVVPQVWSHSKCRNTIHVRYPFHFARIASDLKSYTKLAGQGLIKRSPEPAESDNNCTVEDFYWISSELTHMSI